MKNPKFKTDLFGSLMFPNFEFVSDLEISASNFNPKGCP
jgi:hypothetical protein